MKRWLPALLLALGVLAAAAPAAADWPAWMERWLFNAEERTQAGMSAFAHDDERPQAAEHFDSAARLTDDSVARFNAGTARLGAGLGGFEPLLQEAAESDSKDLASGAHYNLGNAKFAAQDYSGAIEAYKDALRAAPDFEDAKFNLELARKKLEEQKQQQQDQQNQDQQDQEQQDQQQQDQQQDQQEQQDQQQEQQQDQQQQDQQQDQQQQDQQQQEQQQQDQQQPQQQQPQQQQKEDPLPQFKDLPDMSAEEAAAILQAVENLEREQRRDKALEAAKANVRGKKDW